MKDLDKDKYKETAKFWNDVWGEDLFNKLPQKVQAELYDFEKMISTWSKVTYTITGGKLSYPNYHERVLVTEWEDFVTEQIQEGVEEELAAQKQQITKAFGGCTNCYGKGYSTEIKPGEIASSDLPDDEPITRTMIKKPQRGINFCTCERGKALEDEMESQRPSKVIPIS